MSNQFYLLETKYSEQPHPYRTRVVGAPFGYSPSYWIRGKKMSPPSNPIEVQLFNRGGTEMAEVFLDSIPLFREDFVKFMEKISIKFQAFPAILRAENVEPITNYLAVNLLSLVPSKDVEAGNSTHDPMFRLEDDLSKILLQDAFVKIIVAEKFNHILIRPFPLR